MEILQTPRLILREFTPADTDPLVQVLGDPETMRYYPVALNGAGIERWIARNRERCRSDGVGLWAMELIATHELIGDCGIVRQQIDGDELYEIGYHLRRERWGHGYATEAASACRDWAFAHLQADRLVSLIRPENLPSRSVAERIGMSFWKEVTFFGLPHDVYSIAK